MIFNHTCSFACSWLWNSRVNWNKQVVNSNGPISRFLQNFSLSRNDNRNNAHDSLYCIVVFKRDRRKTMGKSATVNTLFIGINGKTVKK